jgi:hypothetical protein
MVRWARHVACMGKRTLVRPTFRCENNMKMDFKETE